MDRRFRHRGTWLIGVALASIVATLAVASSSVPPPPVVINSLGRADQLLKSGDFRGAERILRGCDSLESKWLLAQACFHQGLFQDAEDALSTQPDREEVLKLRAQVALRRGDMPGAASAFRRLLRNDPKNAALHKMLAQAESKNGNVPAALASANEALSLAPSDPEAIALVGDLATNGINKLLPDRRPYYGRR